MNESLKKILLVFVFLFALTGQAIADSLSDARKDAQLAYNAAHYEKAAKLFMPVAQQGDALAQCKLGDMYRVGAGVPQDYEEAVRWYRLAAEQGDASAQMLLGIMYENGRGVPKDYVLAHMWVNIAAAKEGIDVIERNSIETHMSVKQLAEAHELARKCIANKFKGC